MSTLYLSDLDGTLLQKDGTVSPYSLQVLQRLIEQGVPFSYATARSLHRAKLAVDPLTVTQPVIVYNGAFVQHPQTGEILMAQVFSKEQVSWIKEQVLTHHPCPLFYTMVNGKDQVRWLIGRENVGVTRYLRERKGDPRFHPVTKAQDLTEGTVFYCTCIGTREEMLPLYEILSANPSLRCLFYPEQEEEYWLECMPSKTGKAGAAKWLKAYGGFDRLVCFGDGENDLDFFREADQCYAVANAIASLQEMATAVIDSHDQDGVARWMLQNAKP